MAVAAADLRISIDSISFGLISESRLTMASWLLVVTPDPPVANDRAFKPPEKPSLLMMAPSSTKSG